MSTSSLYPVTAFPLHINAAFFILFFLDHRFFETEKWHRHGNFSSIHTIQVTDMCLHFRACKTSAGEEGKCHVDLWSSTVNQISHTHYPSNASVTYSNTNLFYFFNFWSLCLQIGSLKELGSQHSNGDRRSWGREE